MKPALCLTQLQKPGTVAGADCLYPSVLPNCNAPYSSWRKNENYGLKEELPMNWNHQKVAQLKLPDPADEDPHPRLMLDGNGIHAGSSYTALFPDVWNNITLEVSWKRNGPDCWYISTPDFSDICPVGLCVKL